MSSSIVFKVFCASTAGTAALSGAAFLTYKQIYKTSKNENKLNSGSDDKTPPTIYAIVEVDDSQDQTTPTQLLQNKRNYSCQLTDTPTTKDENCVVQLISFDASHKKQIKFSDLATLSVKDPTIEELKTNNNYFKVKITSTFLTSLDLANAPKKIDVFTIGEDSKKLATLNPLFGINGSTVSGKTLHSVGKVSDFKKSSSSIDGPLTIQSNNTTKCVFDSSNTELACKIVKFTTDSTSNPSIETLNFSTDRTALGSVEKNKFYLFEHTTASDKKDSTYFNTSGTVKVTVTPDTANPVVDTIEVSNLLPAIVAGSSGQEKIFFLK